VFTIAKIGTLPPGSINTALALLHSGLGAFFMVVNLGASPTGIPALVPYAAPALPEKN